ncbi:MAG: hypothetical protein FJ144_03685 [Deltaproteobacteria bacterium]|nr:hypothetical protein [Deltaproteobacteria bacterium]
MPKEAETVRIVIKKKAAHAAHHGGAWKVAYADFVTAMMALFMVLWLLTQADVKLRSQIAQYFRDPGILPGGSVVSDEKSAAHRLEQSLIENDMVLVRTGVPKKQESADSKASQEQEALESHAKALEDAIQRAGAKDPSLEKLRDQVIIEVRDSGLSIQVIDQARDPTLLFDLSSSDLKPPLVSLLKKVAGVLGELPNPVQVGGHTDSRPYPAASGKTNWELSFERADNARLVLETSGLRPKQVKRVLSYADSEPLDPGAPLAHENRRLSILAERTEGAKAGSSGEKQEGPIVLPRDEIPVAATPREANGTGVTG